MATENVTFSPYQAAKEVNRLTGRNLPPQMFYSYCQKGYIKSTKVDGKIRIAANDLFTWFERYCRRNEVDLTNVK